MVLLKAKRKKHQVDDFAKFEVALSEAVPVNPVHVGSNFDDFLKEEGIFETVKATSIKRVIIFQLMNQMRVMGLTKVEVAKRMNVSRGQLNRLLDPNCISVNLELIIRAASCVGRKFSLTLA